VNTTSISWSDYSSNPLKYRRKSDGKVVWGCVKTSPGCAHCYSEALALRFDRGRLFNAKNMEELEPFLDDAELRQMLTAKRIGGRDVSGSRCFTVDMSDVFGAWVPDEMLDRLFAVMALRPDVTFQVLTKRAERMRDYMTLPERKRRIADQTMYLSNMLAVAAGSPSARIKLDDFSAAFKGGGPIRNLHLGVSVEDQQRADERIPHLLGTPAAVRFLSCEPLLSALDLSDDHGVVYCNACGRITAGTNDGDCASCGDARTRDRCYLDYLNWIIVGGESGPQHRDCDPAWIADVVRQCKAAGVPVFVKQSSGPRPGMQGRIPDDVFALKEFPEAAP
jgi:protein gp37